MKNSIYQSFIRMYGMRTIYAPKVIAKIIQQDELFNYFTEQVQLLYIRKDRHILIYYPLMNHHYSSLTVFNETVLLVILFSDFVNNRVCFVFV